MANFPQNINCLIIGAGNIGGLYDNPGSAEVLTHAHAYSKHKNFNLLGFVDSDIKKSQEVAEIWGVNSFENIEGAFAKNPIDVVSVATSDNSHYEVIKRILLNFPVKLIFAEKPLAQTIEQGQELIELSQKKNIPILVNYSRRFVPELQNLKKDIFDNVFGEYLSGNGYYGKGILHNGSHMIDLLRFLLGEIEGFHCFDKIYDFYKNDPSISARFSLCSNRSFTLNAIDCRNFTIFEIDLVFEKARVKILNSGFEIEKYQVLDSKIYKNYQILNLENAIDTSLDKALYYAVDNICGYFSNYDPLKCNVSDGLEGMRTPLQMINKMSK